MSVLFTMVHVPQYLENPGVIAAITLLSFSLTVVRAWTGRLLPCFIIHLIFNALQAAVIVLEPFIKQAGGDLPNAPTAALLLGALQFFT